MRKNSLITVILTVLLIITAPVSVFAGQKDVNTFVDFTVTEKINMSAIAGRNELKADRLDIINNGDMGILNIDSVRAETANGWELVRNDEDFSVMPQNSKKISVLADEMHDMIEEYKNAGEIKPGMSCTVEFKGNTGIVTETVADEKAADIVITVSQTMPLPLLLSGTELGKHIMVSALTEHVKFTDEVPPPSAVLTDVSENQDRSVVAWNEGNTLKISSRIGGQKIIAGDCSYMFSPESLTSMARDTIRSIDFSNLNTDRVESMRGMFCGSSVRTLDLSSISMENVRDAKDMFKNCIFLYEVSVGENFAFSKEGQLPSHNGSSQIPSADGKWYAKSDGTGYLPEEIPVQKADTYSAFKPKGEPVMQRGLDFNTELPYYNDEIKKVIFTDERAPDLAKTRDVSENRDNSVVAWLEGETYKISSQVDGKKVIAGVDMSDMFNADMTMNAFMLTEIIDLSGLDTSNVTEMDRLFYGAYYLREVNLSIDTGKVESMSQMIDTTGRSLKRLILGERFAFSGSNYGLADGIWYAQSDGKRYLSREIPANKADVYVFSSDGSDPVSEIELTRDNLGYIGYKSGVSNLIIPDILEGADGRYYKVTSIFDYTFAEERNLKKLVLPNSLSKIKEGAFQDCSALLSVYIPKSIMEIGGQAFNQCNALKDVYYGGSVEEWNRLHIGSFNDSLLNAEIHCNSTWK